jgi:hypothetical protein
MSVKVYLDPTSQAITVDNGTAQSNVIDVDTFFFEKNDATSEVTLRDRNDDYKLRTLSSDVQNEAGAPIGTYQNVVDFLITLMATANASIDAIASELTPETRTPFFTRATTGGTILAGARSVSFFNSGGNDIPTVLGAVIKQDEEVSFNAGGEGDTLAAIVYTVASGELLIAEIR